MAFSICETWLSYSFMHRFTHTQRVTSRSWLNATQITRKNHFTHMNAANTYEWVMSHTQTRDVTHTNESRDTHEQVTSHLTRDSALQTFSTPQIPTILMHTLANVAGFQNFCNNQSHPILNLYSSELTFENVCHVSVYFCKYLPYVSWPLSLCMGWLHLVGSIKW